MTSVTNLSTVLIRLYDIGQTTLWRCHVFEFEYQWSAGIYNSEHDESDSAKYIGYYAQCVNKYESCLDMPLFSIAWSGNWSVQFEKNESIRDGKQNRSIKHLSDTVNENIPRDYQSIN